MIISSIVVCIFAVATIIFVLNLDKTFGKINKKRKIRTTVFKVYVRKPKICVKCKRQIYYKYAWKVYVNKLNKYLYVCMYCAPTKDRVFKKRKRFGFKPYRRY